MSFTFRPAIREQVPLLIGLAGGTGSGKTFSAMRIAKGLSGITGKRFAIIDTEAGRGRHYADQFSFDHGDLAPPFTPERYADAIVAADKAGYPVIVVDSTSHVWSGDGGCLDMQEAELDRMAGDNWQKRESCKMAAWIKPKIQHKRMTAKLLQIRAHVILCFRAEPKVEMTRVDGKMQVAAKVGLTGIDGWFPICEKMLPYELTLSVLLLASKPGVPLPIKMQEQHRAIVPLDRTLDESVGVGLAAWSSGGAAPQSQPEKPTTEAMIDAEEAASLRDAVISAGLKNEFREKFKVATPSTLPASKVDEAWAWLKDGGK